MGMRSLHYDDVVARDIGGRGPTGRGILGWFGVLMILGAIGWAAFDWYRVDWNR